MMPEKNKHPHAQVMTMSDEMEAKTDDIYAQVKNKMAYLGA